MSAAWIVLILMLGVTVALLMVVVLGLISRVNELEARTSRAPTDALVVPGDHLPVVPGFEISALTMTGGTKRLVLFLSSLCGPCRKLADDLRATRDEPPLLGTSELLLITDREGASSFADVGASHIVIQTAAELTRAWGIPGTPFAVAVDETETIIATGFVRTRNSLAELSRTLG